MSKPCLANRRFFSCLVYLLALFGSQLQAQVDRTFYIDGNVLDEAGAPVYQARLILERFGYNTQRAGFTNHEGRFAFERLSEGTYTVRVMATGYKDHSETVSLLSMSRHLRIVLTRDDQSREATPSGQPVVSASTLKAPGKARKAYDEAVEAQKRGDNSGALKRADEAIRLYPDFADAYTIKGFVYLQERKLDDAQAAFDKALVIEPQLSDALLGIGRLYNSQSRFAEAEKRLLEARTVNPDAWQVNYELGRACVGLGKNAEAERYLRQARGANPSYPSVYYMFAQVLLLLDRPAEAVPEMEAYLRLVPNGPTADKVRDLIRRIKAWQAQSGAPAKDRMLPTG